MVARLGDDMTNSYTFDKRAHAHTFGRNAFVIVPDQVAADQKHFDGRSFPVLRMDGTRTRATLRGDEYGLHTSGTGDMVVSL